MRFFLIGLLLIRAVKPAPTLVYPLQDQEPPVARVGKSFFFDLLDGSFTSSSSITYTTSTLPTWLTFSSSLATFYGTPSAGDIGETDITLTATDSTGTTTSNFTLIVTNFTSPAVHKGFVTQISSSDMAQISSATRLPTGTGVSVPPYWSFSVGFEYDTFRISRTEPTNGELYFSAHERGTTTLPDWLSFNNDTFTFNGVAPGNGTYTIVATGTDFWGYTGAQSSFIIEVGQGQVIELAKGQNLSGIVTMARDKVDYIVDLSAITIGGETAKDGDVQFSLDGSFPWLSASSNVISGTTPDQFQNGTLQPIPIPLTISSTNASDTFSLTTYLALDVVPYFFTVFDLPNGTVKPGDHYSFNLEPYLANTTAKVNATITPSDAAQWLMFDTTSNTLAGTSPSSPNYKEFDVVFQATATDLTATATLKVAMEGVTATGTNSTTAVPTTASPSGHHHGLSKAGKIAIGVVFGVLGLVLLALLLFFCCRRRKREKVKDDNDSFVVGSPTQDPFRKSEPNQRNIMGEIAKFSPFGWRTSAENPNSPQTGQTDATIVEKPHRMSGLKGIFGWGDEKKEASPRIDNASGSFVGSGEFIHHPGDLFNRPSQEASSFTQTFGSSGSSRASWESRRSFHWSSENEPTNRQSMTESIPRPRQDFTPRYPRNNSPTVLAQLTSQHSLTSPEFSEFHSEEDSQQSGSLGSFPPGPSQLGRFESSGFRSIDEESEVEGPAVVAMAERQSFETRKATEPNLGPRLKSTHQIASPIKAEAHKSTEALPEDGAFDDADEARRSTIYAPSEGTTGLYPASQIYFGSPDPDRTSSIPSEARTSTIRAVPPTPPGNPLSPPLPQVGSFIRHRRTNTGNNSRPTSGYNDGRVVACANETFSIHPHINPPPTVSLSAATWSSQPPSTYRAVVEGGGSLPSWLHFDARELELWGVPALKHSGETTVIRIMETLPRDKRRSDPMAFGYEPPQEREVGRVIIEVVDRLKSPQFALEGSPHAL